MTVRGDSWVVCMVCTPIRFTLLAKGRRVHSQVILNKGFSWVCRFSPSPGVLYGFVPRCSFYGLAGSRSSTHVVTAYTRSGMIVSVTFTHNDLPRPFASEIRARRADHTAADLTAP